MREKTIINLIRMGLPCLWIIGLSLFMWGLLRAGEKDTGETSIKKSEAVQRRSVEGDALKPWGELSFNQHIRPILSDNCFACHGPDSGNRKADLRLDTEEAAKAKLGGYAAIVEGKPDQSEIIDRIETSDEDDIMPPLDSHLRLSQREKEMIREWVKQGAKWEAHWAFQAVEEGSFTKVPKGQNGVDYFVRRKLNQSQIPPARPASKAAWLRRVSQDLAGLPPTADQLQAFLQDNASNSYAKVVDRLLASSDYAEQMTSIWLDNARYADSNGYQFDNERTMWPWRDWVLEAFSKNMPYDQFVIEQLAGDLLEEPSQAQLIATGFNRNHGYSIEGGILEDEYRAMYASDKTATFGTLFLGLTLDCARCHDHKYDPVSIKDYYSLFAFFDRSAEKGAPGPKGRTKKAAPPYIQYTSPRGEKALAMIMQEVPRETRLLKEGLFDQPGEVVQPTTPEVLPSFKGYAPNRLGLANWLTAPENPLFARVTVNRVWQQFFGKGLVKTSDNFGLQGDLPSHPELLDWLAYEFKKSSWDLQHVMRLIVLSKTYQQSSDGKVHPSDPENRLLARGPRFRLSAEQIRDQALLVSGLMSKTFGGPSVRPYQPAGVWEDLNAPSSHAEVYRQDKGENLYRKSLYTYWRRSVLHPALSTFDAPSRDVCSVERTATNTPLQALLSLHSPILIEASRALAERVFREQNRVALGFTSILSRPPSGSELRELTQLYRSRLQHYQANKRAVEELFKVGSRPVVLNDDEKRAELAALTDVYHVVFNLSETITRK